MALREFIGHNHPSYSLLGDYCCLYNCRYTKIAYAVPRPGNQADPSLCCVHVLEAFGSRGLVIPTKYPHGISGGLGSDGKWLEWFKLSLPHKDDLPHDVRISKKLDNFTKEREALDMSAVHVTSEFLKVIWKNAHEVIRQRVKMVDEFAQCHILITVTVPVIWPADARKRLYQAIQASNILGPNVRLSRKFVTEAEATGIAIMSASSIYPGNSEVGRVNPSTTYKL